jgi:hypothetical protein
LITFYQVNNDNRNVTYGCMYLCYIFIFTESKDQSKDSVTTWATLIHNWLRKVGHTIINNWLRKVTKHLNTKEMNTFNMKKDFESVLNMLFSSFIVMIYWSIDYLLFYVLFENLLLVWRCHHCLWMAANLSLCSAPRAFRQKRICIVPHLMRQGTGFFLFQKSPHFVDTQFDYTEDQF